MVGYGGQDSGRRLAKRLLDEQVKFIDPRVEGIEVVTSSIRDVVKEGHLAEWLFNGLATTVEAREEIFGFGNQHIDTKFESLGQAVIRLAATGHCDRDVLREGEDTLQRLIQGMLELEWECKPQIAPPEAARQAIWDDLIRDALGKKEGSVEPRPRSPLFLGDEQDIMDAVSPNQLDAAQSDALFMYQVYKCNRNALGVLLAGLQAVNRALDKDGPAYEIASPSR